MRELATRFQANPRYWLLASGTRSDVQDDHARVRRRFGAKANDGYRDQHTTFVYVFNADGALGERRWPRTALSDEIVEAVRREHWMTGT